MLECVNNAGLKVKLRKCRFSRKRLRYLGHLVGEGRMAGPEDRVTALKWPLPMTKRKLKSFLGVVVFYQRFIKDFADHAAVLTPLASKHEITPGSPESCNVTATFSYLDLVKTRSKVKGG